MYVRQLIYLEKYFICDKTMKLESWKKMKKKEDTKMISSLFVPRWKRWHSRVIFRLLFSFRGSLGKLPCSTDNTLNFEARYTLNRQPRENSSRTFPVLPINRALCDPAQVWSIPSAAFPLFPWSVSCRQFRRSKGKSFLSKLNLLIYGKRI